MGMNSSVAVDRSSVMAWMVLVIDSEGARAGDEGVVVGRGLGDVLILYRVVST
jgi:hypothetical protein